MNIPVVQGGINMDGLLKWLQGNESFLQVKAGRSIYTYMRIPVEDGADYIYEQDSKGSWIPYFRDSFRFGGVYIRQQNRLYCCNNIIRDWRVSGLPESSCEDLKTLLKEFKAAVNERVADVVASDPKKYAARSLPGKAKEELSAYRKYIVYEDAINLLVASKKPEDVRFVRGYDPRDWEDSLAGYLKDREGFINATAKKIIKQGDLVLLGFLKADVLRKRYIKLLSEPNDPGYVFKTISDAVAGKGKQNVDVTIRSEKREITVSMCAADLVGYREYYSARDLAPHEMIKVVYRYGHSQFTAREIVRIACDGETLYKSYTIPQKGEPKIITDPDTMGGM